MWAQKWFTDSSIRFKLIVLFLLIAVLSAFEVALPMGVFDYLGLRQAMARDLSTLADAIARNSTAALSFRDIKSANDVLDSLRADPSVVAACLYDEKGKPFADYVREDNTTPAFPPRAEGPTSRFEKDRLIQFRNITLNGEALGAIYIQSDVARLNRRVREYIVLFAVTMILTLVFALALAERLQQPISRPLQSLVATAEKIAHAHDYTVRADLSGENEFGVLGAAFNGMLEQIHRRDCQLRHHRHELEQEVAARTTELMNAVTQLQQAEEKYRTIFENAAVGIFQLDPDGRPLSANSATAHIHGYESAEQLLTEVRNVPQQMFVDPGQMGEIIRTLQHKDVIRNVEIELYRRDRSKCWVVANFRATRDTAGRLIRLDGSIEDISERKRAQEQVKFLAYYDALTGLPNRVLMQDRLRQALASARRRKEKVALLFLDLDRFKLINDSLGHSFGDALLQQIADRLKRWAREQDTVARIGGDEFLIVLSAIRDASGAAVTAERVMDAMDAEFIIQGRRFHISCSIGISMFPNHGTDSETLIKNADAAMYAAKENGSNNFQFFSDDMNAEAMERLTLEHGLRVALNSEQLFLVYQPQLEIKTGAIVGVEALLRWRHPELGLVPPDRFIPIAENCGLISAIGEWVLQTACSTARTWAKMGLGFIPVAVNVSGVQVRQKIFHEVVARVLRENELPPGGLEIEFTESVLLSNADLTMSLLRSLKNMGVSLAIDDFGTGYSSLTYLRQFPVTKLKIDRSFIRNVTSNPDDAAIANAIISMAKGLNLKVIAEGVETEEQMKFLQAQGCDEVQGFYISQPLTASDLLEALMTRRLDGNGRLAIRIATPEVSVRDRGEQI